MLFEMSGYHYHLQVNLRVAWLAATIDRNFFKILNVILMLREKSKDPWGQKG